MKQVALAFLVVALVSVTMARAADNALLKRLHEEDQADRAAMKLIPYEMQVRDRSRREAALEALQRGGVVTANDHYHAALIFQHSVEIDDIRLAYSLAMTASRIDPEHRKAKWLTAAAWDRILQMSGRPQWYGTQFVRDPKTLKWSLYQTEASAIPDDERVRLLGRTLAETHKLAEGMNREAR